MKLLFTMHAGRYIRFAKDVFTEQIGKEVNVVWENHKSERGRLIDAVVSEDGSLVEIEVEVQDSVFSGIRIW